MNSDRVEHIKGDAADKRKGLLQETLDAVSRLRALRERSQRLRGEGPPGNADDAAHEERRE